MKRYGWIWLCAGGLAVAAIAFALGRMAVPGGEEGTFRPQVLVEEPTREERELQEIKVAASEYDLTESVMREDGWVVRVEHEAEGLEPGKLLEEAKKFFANLDRAQVRVSEATFLAKSSSLRDVWGNRLVDVPLLRLGFDGATFARVNWRGISPDNLIEVASDLWIHDLVLDKLREQASQPQGQAGQGQAQGAGAQQGGVGQSGGG